MTCGILQALTFFNGFSDCNDGMYYNMIRCMYKTVLNLHVRTLNYNVSAVLAAACCFV